MRYITAFTAHCRPRSCGRQRAASQTKKEMKNEKICKDKKGTPVGNT